MTTLALVGDRSPTVRAHGRIPALLDALREHDDLDLDAYWIPTAEVGDLSGFGAIWMLPGSPYASEEGAVVAVETARVNGIPFLGTCGGFQHAMLEYARNVCGLARVQHAETSPDADDLLLVPLACSLVGHEAAVLVTPGSRAEQILGSRRVVERYHCSFGLNPMYLPALRAAGLVFSGVDESGEVRIAELPGHPFFLATLFQPELSASQPHPLIRAFANAAVLAHAR